MPRIVRFDVLAVDLPFRLAFTHAAASRSVSGSVFLRAETETGVVGFGECLPRAYVTGETVASVVDLLTGRILPRLVDRQFASLAEVVAFLDGCDGKAPPAWVADEVPQSAAWAAVDLALLDAVGKATGVPVRLNAECRLPPGLRYSAVQSSRTGRALWRRLLKYRLLGFRQVKLKLERDGFVDEVRSGWPLVGRLADVRVDANMAWSGAQALVAVRWLAAHGIHVVEQPVAAADLATMARLEREPGVTVMADESLHDRASLERLVAERACSAVNVRISKCGGLVAAYRRCCQALDAGLLLQVGCQVGESSLSSAAQLLLVTAVQRVRYAEGCFGLHLLERDPATPVLQFGYGGQPPPLPTAPGLGVVMADAVLRRAAVRTATVPVSSLG
ncbi:MAG: mandelate racemase/muconate lactonizing enzyme family protein [Vicinamibacterales bacterium]